MMLRIWGIPIELLILMVSGVVVMQSRYKVPLIESRYEGNRLHACCGPLCVPNHCVLYHCVLNHVVVMQSRYKGVPYNLDCMESRYEDGTLYCVLYHCVLNHCVPCHLHCNESRYEDGTLYCVLYHYGSLFLDSIESRYEELYYSIFDAADEVVSDMYFKGDICCVNFASGAKKFIIRKQYRNRWFNFPIVSTLRLKTLTDGMRHNRLKIWAHHSRVKRETKDTVNNTYTDSSGYNLYECLCRVLFAICSITMAILLLTAIAMLTISILVLTGLQTISGWRKTNDMGNCQELITIWRKVNKFIKKICQPRCENSSSAAEKQVVQALRTACKRQTFKIASKKQLGLEFLEAFSGSIIIRFVTEMGKSLQKIKDACATGKIREFLPNIFVGTGVESKLGEGDVMWKYFLYKVPCRSSGINVDSTRAAATEKQEEILNPIKLHWNLFVEELDPRKLYADLESKGLLGDQDGIEMLKHVARKDRMVFLLERLNTLKEPGLGYEILLDHCRENDVYVLEKIMEKEELQKPQEQSTSTGWMSDQKLMFSATIRLSVHRKASTIGMKKNTGPECDKEFEITCLDVVDPVCYFDNPGEDMEGDDDLQEIVMKLEQIRELEEEKSNIKTKQPCLKRKRNMQIDA